MTHGPRGLLAAAALLAVAAGLPTALAAEPPQAELAVAAFASEVDAVVAATSAVNAQSIREDREYIGAILRRGADFHYSVAPGHERADRVAARLAIPAGYELVAVWHTHGAAAPERRYFSATDSALVAQTGKPLYLADFTGALRVLRPDAPTLSVHAARRLGICARAGCAAGEQLRRADGELVHIPTRAEAVMAVAVRN